jgi:hypothetical protein
MADHTIGGYYRVQFMSVDTFTDDPATTDVVENENNSGDTINMVDQRFRAKWTNTLNDYVSVVWYGEVDTVWGIGQYAGRGTGGGINADSTNVETKNVYAAIKIPDTSISTKIGIQGVADIFESTYVDNDAAALTVGAKFGAANVGFIWSKFAEGDKADEDDQDLYGATVAFAPTDAVNIGIGAYYAVTQAGDVVDGSLQDNDTLLTLGAKAAFAAGPAKIDVGLASQTGEAYDGAKMVDSAAMLAYVKAAMTFGEVKTFARLTYISNDDDANDNNRWQNLSGFEFYKDGLMIFGTDVRYNNGPGGRQAFTAAYQGYGLLGLTLGADMKIAGDYNLHVGAFTGVTLDDELDGAADPLTDKQGTSLGTEINCQLSRNIGEKANVALRGAYALVGDFYDAAPGGTDPDDLTTVSVVLNIGY